MSIQKSCAWTKYRWGSSCSNGRNHPRNLYDMKTTKHFVQLRATRLCNTQLFDMSKSQSFSKLTVIHLLGDTTLILESINDRILAIKNCLPQICNFLRYCILLVEYRFKVYQTWLPVKIVRARFVIQRVSYWCWLLGVLCTVESRDPV